MAVQLPPGWVITSTVELVPDPNNGLPVFARRTYICTDAAGSYVCSSGAEEDCEAQALSMAQCRTQQNVTI